MWFLHYRRELGFNRETREKKPVLGVRPTREMDVAGLRGRIQATLDTNADTRRQAEIDLKYVGG